MIWRDEFDTYNPRDDYEPDPPEVFEVGVCSICRGPFLAGEIDPGCETEGCRGNPQTEPGGGLVGVHDCAGVRA